MGHIAQLWRGGFPQWGGGGGWEGAGSQCPGPMPLTGRRLSRRPWTLLFKQEVYLRPVSLLPACSPAGTWDPAPRFPGAASMVLCLQDPWEAGPLPPHCLHW